MNIVICGKGPGWDKAPPLSNLYEVWGATQLINRRPVDVVFDMNNYALWGDDEERDFQVARQNVIKSGVRAFYLYMDPEVPTSEAYPIVEIIEFFGTDYFNSTIDYMIAYAIYSGVKRIDIFGVAMGRGTEYEQQKAGVEFWIGMAMGMGTEVNVHEPTSILKTFNRLTYGYGIPQCKR